MFTVSTVEVGRTLVALEAHEICVLTSNPNNVNRICTCSALTWLRLFKQCQSTDYVCISQVFSFGSQAVSIFSI